MRTSVCTALALCMVTALSPAVPATAQSWPERTVRIVIPLPAGSPSDVALRRLGEKLAERWAQPVVIENKQGADGILAVTAVLGARDEHTLLFSFPGVISINPYLHDKLPYDPKDLVPIVPVLDNFIGFAASSSLGVKTLDDLIANARANPGKISWSALPGVPNYVFLALQKRHGFEAVRVGYRDFAPAYQDLHQGRVQVLVAGITNFKAQQQAGAAVILAVVNSQRAPLAPDVPTVAEAGFPELTFDSPVGLYAPRNFSSAAIARIEADVRAITGDLSFRQRLIDVGVAPRSGTLAEFTAAIEEQRAKIGTIHAAAVRKEQP
jgi:tripartite-type tricarboxylate transporter receptor subunit TctC